MYYVFAPRALVCATRSRSRTQRGASAQLLTTTEANALSQLSVKGLPFFFAKIGPILSTRYLKSGHVLTLINLHNLLLQTKTRSTLSIISMLFLAQKFKYVIMQFLDFSPYFEFVGL